MMWRSSLRVLVSRIIQEKVAAILCGAGQCIYHAFHCRQARCLYTCSAVDYSLQRKHT